MHYCQNKLLNNTYLQTYFQTFGFYGRLSEKSIRTIQLYFLLIITIITKIFIFCPFVSIRTKTNIYSLKQSILHVTIKFNKRNIKTGILWCRGILRYIHLYCKLKSSIFLPICKAVSRKKIETHSSIRKGKIYRWVVIL